MIRIGTRASALALAQAHSIAAQIPGAEIVEITTPGDRGERLLDKSRWVSELESALLDGRIDLAVHSAKDVPGELAAGTEIAAIPVREDPRDALIGAGSLLTLPAGARVGTSSLRRAAQLRAVRDDLEIVELRGNIDTRLRKLAEGEYDAIVLAAAGLHRLGRVAEIRAYLDDFVPAPGQGALLIQARAGDALSTEGLLTDAEAQTCVLAERELAHLIGATCHTPFGARGSRVGQDTRLRAWAGLPDGTEWIEDELTAPTDEVAQLLAERLTKVGAPDLLDRAEAAAEAVGR